MKIYDELLQGSDEWMAARCGLLTASEMKLIITPTDLKPAKNDKVKAHLYELTAQRITKFVEPHYINDDMMRGHEDEVEARILYEQHYAPVDDVGFITNDKWGFTLGCSPDGLVGKDGAIECKSRRQKYQMQTLLEGDVPAEHIIQVQTIMLVSERDWVDYISYSAGMPMVTLRVYPDTEMQCAILAAAEDFEDKIKANIKLYDKRISSSVFRTIPTERRKEEGIIIIEGDTNNG